MFSVHILLHYALKPAAMIVTVIIRLFPGPYGLRVQCLRSQKAALGLNSNK